MADFDENIGDTSDEDISSDEEDIDEGGSIVYINM